jgi:ubiquinone biosynthesis protein
VIFVRVVAAIAIAVLVTVVSLRLLGMRRGWGRALASGLIGWGIAAVVALNLVRWDWGADRLFVHTLVIGIPTTMAVAVVLDLLARPGSLALGERAGLVTPPRPLRALRRRIEVLRRYRELIRLARREGFGPLTSSSGRADRTMDAPGVRIRRMLEDAGGVYIKLGQIAATRVDFVPPDIARELGTLQNRVAPVAMEDVKEVLESELGTEVEKVFVEFECGDLRIRHVMDEDGRRTVRTLANRALLSAVGAAFLAIATLLLVAAEDGPRVASETGLFEIFGYGGLLLGTVLLLRVVAAVARDGTT